MAEGLLRPGQLRGPHVRRVLHGVYRPAWVTDSHTLRCEAAGLVAPRSALLTGRSMATVCGVPLARVSDPVEMAVPEDDDFRVAGLRVRRVGRRVDPGPAWRTTHLAGAFRFGFDLAARYPLPLGTAHLDRVVRAGLLDLEPFRAQLDRCGDRDVRDVRRAAALVDPRSESVPESQVRVILQVAGLPVVPQHVVTYQGRPVARVDLALIEERVAVEYDGAWHALREQLEADRQRLDRLRDAGWDVVHVTASMLRNPQGIVDAVNRARSRPR